MADVPFDDNVIKALTLLFGFRVSKNPPNIRRYDIKGLTKDPYTEVILEESWRVSIAKRFDFGSFDEGDELDELAEAAADNYNEKYIPLYEDVQSFNELGIFQAKIDMNDIPDGDATDKRRVYRPRKAFFMTTSGAESLKILVRLFLNGSNDFESYSASNK